MNKFSIIRILNDLLWIILGLLIILWLFYPNQIIEIIIWIGFSVGCILIGILDLYQMIFIINKPISHA